MLFNIGELWYVGFQRRPGFFVGWMGVGLRCYRCWKNGGVSPFHLGKIRERETVGWNLPLPPPGMRKIWPPGKLTNDNRKTTMNEDAPPMKNVDFPASHVSFRGILLMYFLVSYLLFRPSKLDGSTTPLKTFPRSHRKVGEGKTYVCHFVLQVSGWMKLLKSVNSSKKYCVEILSMRFSLKLLLRKRFLP